MLAIVAALAILAVAVGSAEAQTCPPGLIIDHCNYAVSGYECYNPPYEPTAFGDMAVFPERAVINALGWNLNVGTIYAGGQGVGDSVEGRQLHNSSDFGTTAVADNRPPGAIQSLALDGEGSLLVGSFYRVQQDGANPEASFTQFRQAGSQTWVRGVVSGFDDHLAVISVNERGAQFLNGTYYIVAISTYEIVPPTPDDPWSRWLLGKSRDGVNWAWSIFPVPEALGIYEAKFINETHGIAIGGRHYSDPANDYIAYILVTSDGGVTWEETYYDEDRFTFTDLDCAGTTCWVTGNGLGATASLHIGIVFRSTTLGRTWVPQITITGSATSYVHFWHVHFFTESYGYAQGDYQAGMIVMYITEDGGQTWKVGWTPNCDNRFFVHDMLSDNSGQLIMLLQKVDDTRETGFMRVDYPSTRKANLIIS